MSANVRLDQAEIGRWLREDMPLEPVLELAQAIAAGIDVSGLGAVKGQRLDEVVTVQTGTTDRPVALVTIAHPAGMAMQAKNGVLTRAAADLGFVVRNKKTKGK